MKYWAEFSLLKKDYDRGSSNKGLGDHLIIPIENAN